MPKEFLHTAPPPTVLLVEADSRLARDRERALDQYGFSTILAGDVEIALEIARLHRPDAVVAASDAPPLGAIDLCRRLAASRELADCPLLVYARRYDPLEAALTLEAGAADYTPVAMLPREFAARVRRLVRQAAPRPPRVLRIGELMIDGDACQVSCRGRAIAATMTEFKILQSLAGTPGTVLSRHRIATLVGVAAHDPDDRAVDAHVKNLRRKLGEDAGVLQTVRGFGYRISEMPLADAG